jgi:hypothetical protein
MSFTLPRWFPSLVSVSLGLLLCMTTGIQPASALIKMDSNKMIDAALIYGMQNQKMGIANLLGPNWIEGEKGSLLNVYTPFMVLATKAAHGGFPESPQRKDVDKARTKYGKYVHFFMDPKNKQEVKFAVNFYGPNPGFAKDYKARIVGSGRGRDVELTPFKQFPDQIADPVDGKTFEAINSYYFRFSELENLQEFKLILESPTGEPLTFRLNNEKLY